MSCLLKWIPGMQNRPNSPIQNTVVFRRSPEYQETYLSKIKNNEQLKAKFREFMEVKRNNPLQPFGSSDKQFRGDGYFTAAVSGIKHAHITHDLSIVYKVEGKNPTQIYLYGFYTHDDLGTGQPPNKNRQSSMAKSFSNRTFKE